jgi:hypothetical protein
VRNGFYAIYKGKEYEVGAMNPDIVSLRSFDPNDVSNGFSLYKGVVYIKRVHRSELEEIYRIRTYAEHEGIKFQVTKEDGDKILLSNLIGDYRVFERLGMKMVEKGVYEKWVDKSDVTRIYEEKKPR